MSVGQSSGSGAKTDFEDENVRKDDILSNRDKAQRRPGQGLDGKGVQVDEYKDNPANQRPSRDKGSQHGNAAKSEETPSPAPKTKTPEQSDAPEHVDRPGFDLGGSTGKTHAGKGLGLGNDEMKGRKGWGLPRT